MISLNAEETNSDLCSNCLQIALNLCSEYFPQKKEEYDALLSKYLVIQKQLPENKRDLCDGNRCDNEEIADLRKNFSNELQTELEKKCTSLAEGFKYANSFIEMTILNNPSNEYDGLR